MRVTVKQPKSTASKWSSVNRASKLEVLQTLPHVHQQTSDFCSGLVVQNAKWDEEKTKHAAQVWMVGGQIVADRDNAHHTDLSLAALGNWTGLLYDFHWCTDQVPMALKLYREHQQDARQ